MMKKKKGGLTQDPKFWVTYATFLFNCMNAPDRARDLLERANKSVPNHKKVDLSREFAQLEFKCKGGDPERGRTLFTTLMDLYPKRGDLWDIQIDLETQQGATDQVRQLYERMTALNMKKRRANLVFKKWLKFEEVEGDQKKIDHVKAKAAEYIQRHKGEKDD